MMDETLEGLIYKTMTYQENSKLLYVYTNLGKITLVARGVLNIKSENRILSQYLNLITFQKQNKEMYGLKHATLVDDFSSIKANYELITVISSLLYVIDKAVTSDMPHQKLYDEVIKVLKHEKSYNATLSLLLKLLKPLGFEPTFFIEGKKAFGFDLKLGSIVTDPQNNYDVNLEDLMMVMTFYFKKYDDLPNLQPEEEKRLRQIIKQYYQHHLLLDLKEL